MSYSLNFEIDEQGEIPTLILNQTQPEGIESALAEVSEALQGALDLLAKAVGIPGGKLRVSISGHANPKHEKAEGWSEEFTQINVSVVK